jgi:hypothetical protein
MTIFNDIDDFNKFEMKVKPYLAIGLVVASMLNFHRAGVEYEKEKQSEKQYGAIIRSLEGTRFYDDVLSRYLENLSRKTPSQLEMLLKLGEEGK